MAKKAPLSTDQLAGRIIVLEAVAVAALGLAMRSAGLTPENAVLILNGAKSVVRNRIADPDEPLSAAGEKEAYRYLDQILSNFSEQVIRRKPNQGSQKSDGTD